MNTMLFAVHLGGADDGLQGAGSHGEVPVWSNVVDKTQLIAHNL